MVPVGTKALMRGKLMHTNEITINVGDRWFIKKSAASAIQTCNRMIESNFQTNKYYSFVFLRIVVTCEYNCFVGCNQNLAEYEKEMNLLSTNLEVPKDYEIFASGDVQDIVEPYDEDEEKRWRGKYSSPIDPFFVFLITIFFL